MQSKVYKNASQSTSNILQHNTQDKRTSNIKHFEMEHEYILRICAFNPQYIHVYIHSIYIKNICSDVKIPRYDGIRWISLNIQHVYHGHYIVILHSIQCVNCTFYRLMYIIVCRSKWCSHKSVSFSNIGNNRVHEPRPLCEPIYIIRMKNKRWYIWPISLIILLSQKR